MSVEIEAKVKVNTHDAVRCALKTHQAMPAGIALETNTFLDFDDARLRLSDQGLRVRRVIAEDATESVIITHKGPRLPGAFKNREETELTVESYDHAVRLFQRLGIPPTLSFEKRRETWLLGDCKIELDTLPHLGSYVEIEGPSEMDVKAVFEKLGLSSHALITDSYIALLTAHLASRGDTNTHIRF